MPCSRLLSRAGRWRTTSSVNALEAWAANQAATILSMLFLVAAVVTAVAILPTLAMRNRPAAQRDADQRDKHEGVSDGVEQASQAGIAI